MKRYLTLLIIAALSFSVNAQSSKEINFQVKYQPEHKYGIKYSAQTNVVVYYSGSKQVTETLLAKGIPNPTVKNSIKKFEFHTKTGKIQGDYFPLNMELTHTSLNDEKSNIPEGTIFTGKISASDYTPTLDSIQSTEMDADLKQQLLSTMQNLMAQLNMPEKKLKIGDKFIREVPMSIPSAGTVINMNVKAIYKLKKIENDSAIFNVSEVFNMQTSINGQNVVGKGKGEGKFVYDIKNNFLFNSEVKAGITMKFTTNKVTIKVESNTDIKEEATVSE